MPLLSHRLTVTVMNEFLFERSLAARAPHCFVVGKHECGRMSLRLVYEALILVYESNERASS